MEEKETDTILIALPQSVPPSLPLSHSPSSYVCMIPLY